MFTMSEMRSLYPDLDEDITDAQVTAAIAKCTDVFEEFLGFPLTGDTWTIRTVQHHRSTELFLRSTFVDDIVSFAVDGETVADHDLTVFDQYLYGYVPCGRLTIVLEQSFDSTKKHYSTLRSDLAEYIENELNQGVSSRFTPSILSQVVDGVVTKYDTRGPTANSDINKRLRRIRGIAG